MDRVAIGGKVNALIDAPVPADVCAPMARVSTLDPDFDAKIAGLPHEEAHASRMGHAIRAQIAVYGLLVEEPGGARKVAEDAAPYVVRFDEGLKTVARQVDDVIRRHRSIVDWHLNNDVQREMRRDIKRLLRGTRKADEAALDELARRLVDVARTRPA